MNIIGMNFSNLNATRSKAATGKIKIDNNLSFKNIEKTQFSLGTKKEDVLKVDFEFVASYEPDTAKITIGGAVLYQDKPEEVNKIVDAWKKDKKVPKEIMTEIFNSVFTRCSIVALLLSREINLPPPIQMPKFNVK